MAAALGFLSLAELAELASLIQSGLSIVEAISQLTKGTVEDTQETVVNIDNSVTEIVDQLPLALEIYRTLTGISGWSVDLDPPVSSLRLMPAGPFGVSGFPELGSYGFANLRQWFQSFALSLPASQQVTPKFEQSISGWGSKSVVHSFGVIVESNSPPAWAQGTASMVRTPEPWGYLLFGVHSAWSHQVPLYYQRQVVMPFPAGMDTVRWELRAGLSARLWELRP